MKKYCLTDCAKRKLTELQNIILQISLLVFILILFFILAGTIVWITGFTIQWLGFFTDKNTLDTGAAILFTSAFGGFVLYELFLFLRWTSRGTYKFVKSRYEGTYEKCQIFEECKDEPDELL